MKYVAAYLLLKLGNVEEPKTSDIKKVLTSVGIAFDEEVAKSVTEKLAGKQLSELLAAGQGRMAGLSAAVAAPAAAAVADAPAASAGKEPAKKEPEPEEEDEDLGLGLFD